MSKNNYINNENLKKEIERSKELGYCTEELGEMFLILVERFTLRKYFCRYDEDLKDDLKSNGLVALVNSYWKFDSTKSNNAFAYLSQVVYHSFLQTLNKHYKQKNIKNRVSINEGIEYGVDHYYKNEVNDAGIFHVHKDKESFEDFGKEEG